MPPRITFCDTNILRFLVDHPEKWAAFGNYLADNKSLLVFTLIQLLELKKLPHYHKGFVEFLSNIPSGMFKWWREILVDEVKQYPSTFAVNPILGYLMSGIIETRSSQIELKPWLESSEIDKIWDIFEETKDQYMPVLSWLPSTTPKPQADKNIDFTLHNYGFVLGEIGDVSESFLWDFRHKQNDLRVELFRGSYIRAAYAYYRYIRKGVSPERSDIGDIHQVFYMPYCNEVIVEKSMSGFLHQLQRDKELLDHTNIKSIRFVRELS